MIWVLQGPVQHCTACRLLQGPLVHLATMENPENVLPHRLPQGFTARHEALAPEARQRCYK